jgi:hypothetical protein
MDDVVMETKPTNRLLLLYLAVIVTWHNMTKNKKILHRQKIMETAAKPILLAHIYRFLSGFVNYKKGALDSQWQVISLPAACPWSVVLSGYSSFFHH